MPINSKNIEDILIAKSLGSLSPEADLLLVDYLERNPEVALSSKQYDEVVALAAKAMDSKEAVRLPAFPGEKIRKSAALQIWNNRMKKVSAIAAALVAGFLLGLSFWKSPSLTKEVVDVQPTAEEQTVVRSEPENSFWSGNLSSLREAGARKHKSSRLIWKSFTQKPEIGGDL